MRQRRNAPPVHILVFARAAVGGAVKRRLARGIGTSAATQWYRRALRSTIEKVSRAGHCVLVMASPSASAFRQSFAASGLVADQPGGDLGRRMAMSARRVPAGSIIVGCDIPSLSRPIVAAACHSLGRFDAVFGPATDGGYYLVGLKTPYAAFRLFDRVRWSGPHALSDTLKNAPRHWKIGLLPVLADVDCADDLNRAAQPPASALVMMISSPSRILRAVNSGGRTAAES